MITVMDSEMRKVGGSKMGRANKTPNTVRVARDQVYGLCEWMGTTAPETGGPGGSDSSTSQPPCAHQEAGRVRISESCLLQMQINGL